MIHCRASCPLLLMLLLMLCACSPFVAATAALCNLNGNWTNSANQHPNPSGSNIVHIQFFQAPGNASFTVRATPW